jgi:hypothetical protein
MPITRRRWRARSRGPAALIFMANAAIEVTQEQTWESEIIVRLVVPALGALVAEVNALEPLIEPIVDHFQPGTQAFLLAVPGQSGNVHHCMPSRFEMTQTIDYAGHVYSTITAYFAVKHHRYAGED